MESFKIGKRLFAFTITLALVMALMPMASLTVYGAQTGIKSVIAKSDSVDVEIDSPINGSVLIAAVYNNNKLLNVAKSDVTTSSISLPIDTTAGDVLKVMIWDGISTMKPLCSPVSLKKSGNNWLEQSTRIALAAAQVGPPGDADLSKDTTNYGNQTYASLRTEVFGGRWGITAWGRNVYLKFDLSDMSAIATDKAVIRIYLQGALSGKNLLLIQHPDTSLTQDTVTGGLAAATWPGSDGRTKFFPNPNVPAAVGWFNFDVTTIVKEEINKGNTEIAFLLFQTDSTTGALMDTITALRATGGGINVNAPNMVIDTYNTITDDMYTKAINDSASRAAMLLSIGALETSSLFNLADYNSLWKDGKDAVADDLIAGRPYANLEAVKTRFDSKVAALLSDLPKITNINLLPSQQLDLPTDFKGDILANAVTTPSKTTGLPAANAELTWFVSGGDATVVDLNPQTGVMYLTGKPGVVKIKAKANVGGVESNEFTLNAEAVPYNDTDQQWHLPPTSTPRIDIEDYLKWPVNVGDANVALWYGNATGAFTFGVDDNSNVSGGKANWLRMNNQYGAVFNFNVHPSGVTAGSATANDWLELLAAGNVIQSHTWSHTNHVANGYTSAQTLYEYSAPIKAIEAITGEKVLVFAGADGSVRGDELAAPLHAITRGGYQNPSYAGLVNYLGVNTISGDGIHAMTHSGQHGTREALIKSVTTKNYTVNNSLGQPTNYYGGWTNIFTHAWGTGTEPLYQDWVKPAVDAGLLWTESLLAVGKYAQERDTAIISNKVNNIASGSYSFDITDKMADTIYDYPLTVKVKVDASWTGVSAKQDSKDVAAKIVTNTEGTFVMVDAVPDRGTVVLTKK